MKMAVYFQTKKFLNAFAPNFQFLRVGFYSEKVP